MGSASPSSADRCWTTRVEIRPFPAELLPIQVGDDPPGPGRPETMSQMGRAALHVTVRANGRDVHLVNAHLKSKLLTFPGGFTPVDEDQRARFAAYALYRRASEATTIRTHLDGLLAGGGRDTAVILLGDMNDEPDAATTLILNGPPGSEIGSVGFGRPDRGDGDRMWNTANLIPEAKRFTRLYRGRKELLDHIFVSHFLVDGPDHRGHDRHRRAGDAVDRRQPRQPGRRAGLRPRRRGRDVRPLAVPEIPRARLALRLAGRGVDDTGRRDLLEAGPAERGLPPTTGRSKSVSVTFRLMVARFWSACEP